MSWRLGTFALLWTLAALQLLVTRSIPFEARWNLAGLMLEGGGVLFIVKRISETSAEFQVQNPLHLHRQGSRLIQWLRSLLRKPRTVELVGGSASVRAMAGTATISTARAPRVPDDPFAIEHWIRSIDKETREQRQAIMEETKRADHRHESSQKRLGAVDARIAELQQLHLEHEKKVVRSIAGGLAAETVGAVWLTLGLLFTAVPHAAVAVPAAQSAWLFAQPFPVPPRVSTER